MEYKSRTIGLISKRYQEAAALRKKFYAERWKPWFNKAREEVAYRGAGVCGEVRFWGYQGETKIVFILDQEEWYSKHLVSLNGVYADPSSMEEYILTLPPKELSLLIGEVCR